MELNTIKNNGSWSELAGLLNDNFAKINTQLLKYQDVDAIDGINFVGYVTSVDLLPTPKVAAWAVVGADIKEVSVCAYYLEGSVPVNMTAGWNVLSSLGTYDFTDYSNLLTKVEETDAKVSELNVELGNYYTISETDEKFTETDTKLSGLGSQVNGKATKAELQAEVTRATNAESALSKSIEAETIRSTAAELELRKSINTEVLRAKEAEEILENSVNANRYGYNVTVNGLKGGIHTIETAIKDVPSKFRMLGQKITFRTENGDWATYHNESLSLDNFGNVNDWVQEVGISSVQGDVNITNAPDYEDLTEAADGTIKFADKEYNKDSFSGLGRVYLRKNIVDGMNVLTQDMMSKPNTIYIIQYDYDLQNAEITIPEGCVLDFQGGVV